MASHRTVDLESLTRLPPPVARPTVSRFTDMPATRGGRLGQTARGDRAPPLRHVTIDSKRPARVHPAAVASALQFADLAIVLIAGVASFIIQSGIGWPLAWMPSVAAALVVAMMTRGDISELGRRDVTRQRLTALIGEGVTHTLAAFALGLVTAVAIFQPDAAHRAAFVAWLLLWCATAISGVVVSRLVLATLRPRWRAAGRLKQLVAIYGTGDLAERLVGRLRTACPDTVEIVGVFDDRAGRRVLGVGLTTLPHGTTAELVEMSRQFEIDRIVVALPHSAEKRLLEILRSLHKMPVEISLAPDMVGFNLPTKDHEEFGGLPLIDVYGRPLTFGQNLVKTVFDRVMAAIGIVVLSPILLAIAAAIRLDSKGPILFRQNRYGFGDRVVQVFKFRTMSAESADANGEKQTAVNDPRITRVGGFLRRWSLDELPQLLNVLRGELSLVGPRPHAISMRVKQRRNEDIVPDYALRHHVKPGITGWAQVNGYHGPVETERALHKRVAYDLDYIHHWSLWFDIRILVKTVFIAFGHRKAY
jgi:polysaccharide biosynthesis protein PslA